VTTEERWILNSPRHRIISAILRRFLTKNEKFNSMPMSMNFERASTTSATSLPY